MMGEFDSSSTIKYMIGPSMIKYQVLDDLFKNIRINEHVVVFHVDAWSILYRMYRTKYLETIHSVPTEVLVKDLVVSFINVGMVKHQNIVCRYPSGIFDLRRFFEMPFLG